MPRHQVSQLRRFIAFSHCRQRLFRDVLAHLGIAGKLIAYRAHQRINRGLIARHLVQILGAGLEKIFVFQEIGDLHAALTFDQHFHRAIRQLQQLQHIGQNARVVDPIFAWLILTRINLARQQDLLVVGHDLLKRADRFLAAHKQRHDHMRKHHDVAQRQDGVG